jgi:hypothetical protein
LVVDPYGPSVGNAISNFFSNILGTKDTAAVGETYTLIKENNDKICNIGSNVNSFVSASSLTVNHSI